MSVSTKVILVVILLAIAWSSSTASVRAPQQKVIDFCNLIGGRSGCSGCQIGSGGVCEWCVDPKDTSGQNREGGAAFPQCLPKGTCSLLGGALRSMKRDLCPTLNKTTEPLYGGPVTQTKESTRFHTSHDTLYCDFDAQPYVVDRTTFAAADACNRVNRHAAAGLSMDLGSLSKACFASATELTEAQKFCLKVAQSFACTYNCPKYGTAFTGYKTSSCKRFRSACAPYLGITGCPMNAMSAVLDQLCVDDSQALGTTIDRLVPTHRWAIDYGLNNPSITIPVDPNFMGSKILNDTLRTVLNNWKPARYVLCFQYSRDGRNGRLFHSNCNGKGPTYTIIKSPQGNIFGAYISVSWNGAQGFAPNPDAFTYTLVNPNSIPPTRFPHRTASAFYDNTVAGPNFGSGFDIGTFGFYDQGTSQWDWGFYLYSYNYGSYYNTYFGGGRVGGSLYNGPSGRAPYDTYDMTPTTGELEVFYAA